MTKKYDMKAELIAYETTMKRMDCLKEAAIANGTWKPWEPIPINNDGTNDPAHFNQLLCRARKHRAFIKDMKARGFGHSDLVEQVQHKMDDVKNEMERSHCIIRGGMISIKTH